MQYHIPVLLQSACELLEVQPGCRYIDATFGGGGHSREIINRGGQVLGLDQDPDAIAACPQLDHLILVQSNFIHLSEVSARYHWQPACGVLFDLGVSWHQLAVPERGFSFQSSGPLDMRMDLSLPHTAATLVNSLDEKQLTHILSTFGELSNAKSLAHRIIDHRPIDTTDQLAAILRYPDIQRKVFQSLRVAVNDELNAISTALPQALAILANNGRIVVISFHSLEDRIVKNQFRLWQEQKLGKVLTPNPITPSLEEISANPHSKSAKLRAFKKTNI
jgi:16S rRNA (cytosine1402-N4)-methyltransferase